MCVGACGLAVAGRSGVAVKDQLEEKKTQDHNKPSELLILGQGFDLIRAMTAEWVEQENPPLFQCGAL